MASASSTSPDVPAMSPSVNSFSIAYWEQQLYFPHSLIEQHSPQSLDVTYTQMQPQLQEFPWLTDSCPEFVHNTPLIRQCYSSTSTATSEILELQTFEPLHQSQCGIDSSSGPLHNVDHRRERRKAQNRRAQRKFRAKKDSLIKESSSKLELLERELEKAKLSNGILEATITNLRKQINDLNREIWSIGQSPTHLIKSGIPRDRP